MKVIVGERRTGRTSEILKWMLDPTAKETRIMVVASEHRARQLEQEHPALRRRVLSYNTARMGDPFRGMIQPVRVAIDDVEMFLPHFAGYVETVLISITADELQVLEGVVG
jgi:hypothetical protein